MVLPALALAQHRAEWMAPSSPEFCGDPHLARLEKLLRVLLDSGTQALASKPTQDFANGNGSEAAVWFAQSHEVGTRKVFSKFQGGDPAHKELNDFSELFKDSGSVCRSQGFQEVLNS